jgi:hypothetical protein
MARCKYGRVKSGERKGLCRKTARPAKRRGKAAKRKRACKVWGVLQTKNGPRSACMQFKGSKPSKKHSENWVSYGPTRQEASASAGKPFGPFNPWTGGTEGLSGMRRRRR